MQNSGQNCQVRDFNLSDGVLQYFQDAANSHASFDKEIVCQKQGYLKEDKDKKVNDTYS